MASLIFEKITEHLEAQADQPAIFFGSRTISAREFLELILKFRAGLARRDKNETIAIWINTSVESLACFVASLSVARNTMFLDVNWPIETIHKVARNLEIDLILSDDEYDQEQFLPISQLITESKNDLVRRESGDASPRFTCFTSGSTGSPKGCVRQEASWIKSFAADQEFAGIDRDSVVHVCGNLAHSLFAYASIRALFSGAKISLSAKFNPQKIASDLSECPKSIIFAVPTQLDAIVSSMKLPSDNSIKVLSTGAKLPVHVIAKTKQQLPNAEIVEFYGTSELSYVAAHDATKPRPKTLVGRPLEGVEISIRDVDGKQVSQGDEGLVFVRSELAFDGYATENGFKGADEWISVGDTGFVDQDGHLHLIGRIDRMFQSSGRNIVPELIESAIESIGAVDIAAVIGLPDATRENRVGAIVKLNNSVSRREITDHLAEMLAAYEIPRVIYVCDHWPKTIAGKTDFVTIKQLVLDGQLEELPS